MEDRDWDILLRAIHENQCVLVLGPDSARLPDRPESLTHKSRTLTTELAMALNGQADTGSPDGADLRQAVQRRLYENEEHLYYDVRQFFQRYDHGTTDLHRHLARLPFSLCVQTTPDRFLYNAFAAKGVTPVEAYYDFAEGGGRVKIIGDDRGALMDCKPGRPLIFGLHGHCSDPRSLVLSTNDTLEFLVTLSERTTSLPSFLLRHLGSSDTKFLFFGFGFNRWYSQILLHVLRKDAIRHRRVGRSLALEPDSFFTQDQTTQIATFYNREHSIDFSRLSFDAFAAELDRRYVGLFGDRADDVPVSVASDHDTPLVFLCYNRLDEGAVRRLADELRSRGLRVWWDRDGIKGGDRWSVKLQHTIAQVVDYFVVLHSDNFARRESYSGRELQTALDRAPQLSLAGWRFIIPCYFLGSRERLESLESLDYVELDSPADCDALVATVLDDWTTHNRHAAKRPA